MRPKVFISTHDLPLAQTLICLLYQHGIDAFLVTEEEEEGEKLAQVWEVGAWIRANQQVWSLH